jgi:outer membrane biosynthesis protein TonB
MRKPFLISVAAHMAVVLLAFVTFPGPRELPDPPLRVVPIELVTISDTTNLVSQKKVETPKPPVEEPEPPRPQVAERPTPTPPAPAPAPPPPPQAKPEPSPEKEVKKEEPKPVEKKVDRPTPPKPEPEKKFDPNQIAQLLNKTPDAAPRAQPRESADVELDLPRSDDPALALSLSEVDAVRQRVQECWNVRDFAGSADADKLRASIRFSLNQDGSLAGNPVISSSSGGALSRLFADRAVQAVQKCAPYNFLPRNKYTNWRNMNLNFDMSGMM